MEEKLTKEQELTEAQKFLIKKAREYPPFTTHGLNQLPYALMPAVAKCMDEFVQFSLYKDYPTTAVGSAAAPKEELIDGINTPADIYAHQWGDQYMPAKSGFEAGVRSVNQELSSLRDQLSIEKHLVRVYKIQAKTANEHLDQIRDTLRQRDELIKETTIHDKNGKMIKEGDRVKERLVDFSNDLGYIDVFYTVKWDRWCYCLFIHDKWIKPLDTITSNNIEIA